MQFTVALKMNLVLKINKYFICNKYNEFSTLRRQFFHGALLRLIYNSMNIILKLSYHE